MDYLKIRKLYHSAFTDEESKRRKARLKVYNEDFLLDLPDQVRNTVSNLRWDYGDQPWFEEAWEKYRKHVLDAGLGGKIKMPGFVFNEYIDRYVNEQEKKMKKEFVHMESCDIEDLYHHGVKGQKWGVRRYQNEDGTLTAEGRSRYDIDENGKVSNRLLKSANINRKDAAEIRKAAANAKTEKARKDLLDSADALERLAEQQEAKVKAKYDKYEKQLDEESRRFTNKIALRNYSKDDRRAVLAGIVEKADSDAKAAYNRGQKLISKMKKEGLLNGSVEFKDYVGKYERNLIDKNLQKYRFFVKEQYGRDLTQRDIEWMYYMFSMPVKDTKN